MATGNDPAPLICPRVDLEAPWHVREGACEGSQDTEMSETMQETCDESANGSHTTQPVATPTDGMESRTLRKRASSEISCQSRFQGRNGAYLAVCEYFRLVGFHGS